MIGKVNTVKRSLAETENQLSKFARSTRWCLIPVVGLALAGCGGGIPGNAVVQVGETPITKSTLQHWISIAAASTPATAPGKTAPKPVTPDPPAYTACIAHLKETEGKPAKGQKPRTEAQLKQQCEQQYTSLKQEVLGFLISSQWVIGEASSLGLKVSDKEVHKQFNQEKSQQFPKEAEFQKFLATTGQTVSDLLLRVKASLLSQKIEKKISTKKTSVSEGEVEKYYRANRAQFGTPEKRKVQIILTKKEAQAKSALGDVRSGRSFASVAKSKSIDPSSKSRGGLLAEVLKGQEVAGLDKAIFAASKNVLSGPVKTPFGFYVFEVLGSTPATQRSLAQEKATIKQQLSTQGGQKALEKFVTEFKKKWTAKTDCRPEYVVQDCKQFKAPKTPTGVPPTTATPQTTTAPAPKVTPVPKATKTK